MAALAVGRSRSRAVCLFLPNQSSINRAFYSTAAAAAAAAEYCLRCSVRSKLMHRLSAFCSSETSDLNQGLLIEVWCKGMLWDRALGYCYIPLQSVMYEMVSNGGTTRPVLSARLYPSCSAQPLRNAIQPFTYSNDRLTGFIKRRQTAATRRRRRTTTLTATTAIIRLHKWVRCRSLRPPYMPVSDCE